MARKKKDETPEDKANKYIRKKLKEFQKNIKYEDIQKNQDPRERYFLTCMKMGLFPGVEFFREEARLIEERRNKDSEQNE